MRSSGCWRSTLKVMLPLKNRVMLAAAAAADLGDVATDRLELAAGCRAASAGIGRARQRMLDAARQQHGITRLELHPFVSGVRRPAAALAR